MTKKVYIRTFGCQMNVHDSEKIMGVLHAEGYEKTDDPRSAELIIFNTCSIRQKAEQKFYSELGKIKTWKTKKSSLTIAVAGCIAQQEGANIFRKAPHVDLVFGPQNIHELKNLHLKKKKRRTVTEDNPYIAEDDLPVRREGGIKAWVTIMYGCNNFCSYCVVPYTRGRERSRPSRNILQEVKGLSESGVREITLLGQNVNSYMTDMDFPGLLHAISTIQGIGRIRFVTSHPKDLSHNLIDTIAELTKVCEHIHLPLQSGSDTILQRMNRGYVFKEYMKKVEKLRNKIPGIAITSDIIAGFPGETERDHMNTMHALREIEFDGIFAFNFSPRPGTRAAGMDDILPRHIQSERLTEILACQEKITEKKNTLLEGTIQEILVEEKGRASVQQTTGRTRTNKIVTIDSSDFSPGNFLKVRIVRGRLHSLEGEPA
jgi:tRNA-2-methylthio-N6-dimethylallyladenosine synthase